MADPIATPKVQSILDAAPMIVNAAMTNPTVTLLFIVLGFAGYELHTQPPRIIEGIQAGYDRIEAGRRDSETKRDASIAKMADSIDRLTESLNGKPKPK